MAQKGFTLWFTGLSGAGKTTCANKVEEVLRARRLKLEMLDGDVVRTNLTKGLGFSKEDRDENIRRIGFVANLLTRNDVGVIVSAISPYRAVREEVRQKIGVGKFVEVFAKCPIDVLAKRDVKGLYAKALRGEIANFTGVSDPYEEPQRPEVLIESDREPVETSADRVVRTLELMGLVPPAGDGRDVSEDEEKKIVARLRTLGYI